MVYEIDSDTENSDDKDITYCLKKLLKGFLYIKTEVKKKAKISAVG